MNMSIPSVRPIQPDDASPDGFDPLHVNQVLSSAHTQPPLLSQSAQKFSDMLAQPETALTPVAEVDRSSVLARLVGRHENMVQQTFADVRQLSTEAAQLSPQELVARQIDVQYKMAAVSVQHNASVYLAQSIKNGLTTVMKQQ